MRHNNGAVWFNELGKPWEKHGCFTEEAANNISEIQEFEQLFLVRVRHVMGLVREDGVAIAFGRDRRANDVVDVVGSEYRNFFGSDGALDRKKLEGKWVYVDWTRKSLNTLNGHRLKFKTHEQIVGWKIHGVR